MSAQTTQVAPAEAEVASTRFIARVSSIPFIQDSLSYAKDNKYSRYALDTAGSAVETVNKYTEPYQTRLQPHISKVDQIANKSLDILETTFPIVTKPTAEVVAQVKKPIDNIATTASTTATSIAATVNTRATPLVDGLEAVVNRILPAEAEAEGTTNAQGNQATRVVDITRSVSLRVSRRVSIGAAPYVQSAQDLRKAAENTTALVKSKESIHALNIRLNILVDALRQHAKDLQDNVHHLQGEASQKVLAEIESLSQFLKEHSPKLPESVQHRLEPLVGFVNDRYETVKGELAKTDLTASQKARNILHLTTEETLPILTSAAQDVKETLLQYQISIQENVNRGLSKVHEVNDAAARTLESARVTLVGAK
ncbi:MAG: hypothetical protein J3Q66DRAFT_279117 [Benniella sp.]|nr:MAG: hypothetical protein J3Q66DRAFT_279117 [Benniella sp.]